MRRRTDLTWLHADRKAVQGPYPNASFYERPNKHGEIVEACKVVMGPISLPEDLAIVLADLEEEKEKPKS